MKNEKIENLYKDFVFKVSCYGYSVKELASAFKTCQENESPICSFNIQLDVVINKVMYELVGDDYEKDFTNTLDFVNWLYAQVKELPKVEKGLYQTLPKSELD